MLCIYPEKPIYDIPAHPKVSAQELINNLKIQIEPFRPEIVLNQKVEKIVDHSDIFQFLLLIKPKLKQSVFLLQPEMVLLDLIDHH